METNTIQTRYILGYANNEIEHKYFSCLKEISYLFRELDEEIQEETLMEFEYYLRNFKTHLLQ